MSTDVLLTKLDSVRQVAHGRWRSRCPAHDGKNRDVLSIGETSDGTTLIRCHHGCTALEIVQAVGLELHDLFPRVEWKATGKHGSRPRRPRVDWAALIAALELDLLVVYVLLADIAIGKTIPDEDRTTAKEAAARVWSAIQEARHG